MSEETTKNIPDGRSFEERIFARFDAMDAPFTSLEVRLTSLEDRVERHLMETRPIWEAMQAQLEGLSDKIDRLNGKFDIITSDLYEMRADIKSLNRRVTSLEDSSPQ
jgi:chromosome segregation ATPase